MAGGFHLSRAVAPFNKKSEQGRGRQKNLLPPVHSRRGGKCVASTVAKGPSSPQARGGASAEAALSGAPASTGTGQIASGAPRKGASPEQVCFSNTEDA